MDQECIEVITAGNYYNRNGKHYILYDEVSEDTDEITKNTIKISDNQIDILKNGVTRAHMVFRENEKNMSYYNTPFGQLLIGINTNKIEITKEDHSINVSIDYALEMNYEHVSDCKISFQAKSKEMTNLKLN